MSQAYPVVFSLGCLAGLTWLALRRSGSAEATAAAFTAGLLAMAVGLVGARLGFAALHVPYFRSHPQEILWLWEGGLSWPGGALGAVAAVAVFARSRRLEFPALVDALAAPALLVALGAWAGCSLDGCVYGMRTPPGPLFAPAPDLFGTVAPRWPTAAAGMIATGLLLAAFVLSETRRTLPGLRGAIALGGIALIAVALSFTRGDPMLLVGPARLDTVAAAAVLLLAGSFAAARLRSSRR